MAMHGWAYKGHEGQTGEQSPGRSAPTKNSTSTKQQKGTRGVVPGRATNATSAAGTIMGKARGSARCESERQAPCSDSGENVPVGGYDV